MFVRRLTTSLKQQHWMTIFIELMIVILGVFIGNWVNDWSQERAAERETGNLLRQLGPEMARQRDSLGSIQRYFEVTNHYADTAFAGWRRDPRVSDSQFVIAAYQASQIYGLSANGQTWATIFGGEQLRHITDPAIRSPLQRLMSYDYTLLSYDRVATKYRDNVRLIIPNEIQQQIRAKCGDRLIQNGQALALPPACPIAIPDPERAAAALRAHPELIEQLAQHESAVATQFVNVAMVETQIDALDKAIKRLG